MVEVLVTGDDLLRYASALVSVYDVYATVEPELPGPLAWPPQARKVTSEPERMQVLAVDARPVTGHLARSDTG